VQKKASKNKNNSGKVEAKHVNTLKSSELGTYSFGGDKRFDETLLTSLLLLNLVFSAKYR
jgi:hypothetical protein